MVLPTKPLVDGWLRGKALLYYDTIMPAAPVIAPRIDGVLPPSVRYISNAMSGGGYLKNLAFSIEPAANPSRPTLRDGH